MIIFTKKQVMEEINYLRNEIHRLNATILDLNSQLSYADGRRDALTNYDDISDEEFNKMIDSMED